MPSEEKSVRTPFSTKPYITNPLWHLLGKVLEPGHRPNYKDKVEGHFVLALERVAGTKFPIRNQQAVLQAFSDCRKVLAEYDGVIKKQKSQSVAALQRFIGAEAFTLGQAFTEGGFTSGESVQYQPPPEVKEAQEKSVQAFRRLRRELLKCYSPSVVTKLADALDLPQTIIDSVFRFQTTGVRKLDEMEAVFPNELQGKHPRLLFAANATRDDLYNTRIIWKGKRTDFMDVLRSYEDSFPRSTKPLKPYLYRHDGSAYVAVDLYKGRVSEIRKLMPTIDRLQAKLPGYAWKAKRRMKTLERNLRVVAMRQSDKSCKYEEIAKQLSEEYSLSHDEGLSGGILRTAIHRHKRTIRPS